MARTTGPLMSMGASGTIGNTMTFSSWKGRSYVRRTVIPANPQSPAQVAVRAMLTFLSQAWKSLTSVNQATWNVSAQNQQLSPFNAFVQDNARRWTTGEFPSQATPPTAATNSAALSLIATSGQASANLSLTQTGGSNLWAVAIYRSTTTSFSPTRNACIAIVPWSGSGTLNWQDTGLTAGTYYYRAIAADTSGNQSAPSAAESATAT